MMQSVHVATTNAGKLREFRQMLEPLGIAVFGLEDVPNFAVVEDGDTFAANAIKKATALSQRTGAPALADDSGLVVDALDGRPGVHSARYAGVEGPERDAANRRKLVQAMEGIDEARRTAHFACSLCYAAPDAEPWTVDGTLYGRIGYIESGTNGFGYDPLFIPEGECRTAAELSAEEKNAISHRGRALRKFLQALRERGLLTPPPVPPQ